MEASREMQGIMRMPVGDKGSFMEKCVLSNWAWEGWKCRVGMGGKASLNLGKLKHIHTYRERESALGRGHVKEKAGKIGWGQLLEPWSSRREIHSQFGGHREPVTALE